MKFTKWDVLDGLDTKEAVIEFLAAAFETPDDREYISHAIAVAMQAIHRYNLNMDTQSNAPLSNAPLSIADVATL